MGTIVAKIICGPDADDMYNFHKGEKDPGLCEKCKTRLEMIPNPNYRVRIKGRDVQFTYDGFCIVSERFKNFCKLNNYPDLEFTPVKTKNFYVFLPQGIYQMSHDLGIQYYTQNACCNTFKEVGCYNRLFVRDKNYVQENNDFIKRTDILYGSRSRKSYEIIIGIDTFQKMKEFGLKFSILDDVYSAEHYIQVEPELIRREEEWKKKQEEKRKEEEAYRRAHRWDFLLNLPQNIGKGLVSLFKKQPPKIVYRYGKARPMDKVTLKSMQKYPIWVDEYVETDTYEDNWTKPILDTRNVTEDMGEVEILLTEEKQDIHISAAFSVKEMQLSYLCRWNPQTKDWESVNPITDTEAQQWVLKAIPEINGVENVIFTFDDEIKKFKAGTPQ